jgi:hypothetical protein
MKTSNERYQSNELLDMLDRPFTLGDFVARAVSAGTKDTHEIELRQIDRIENGKMYLSNSSNPVKFPGRLLIVTPSVPPAVLIND